MQCILKINIMIFRLNKTIPQLFIFDLSFLLFKSLIIYVFYYFLKNSQKMIFRTWKSRSLAKLEANKRLSIYEVRNRWSSDKEIKSLPQDNLLNIRKSAPKVNLASLKSTKGKNEDGKIFSAGYLKIERKSQEGKPKNWTNIQFTKKMDFTKNLKEQIPSEGYIYLDITEIHNKISEKKGFTVILQQKNVMVEYSEQQNFLVQLYPIPKFNRILQIINKIGQNEFFLTFYQQKLFALWSKQIKRKRFLSIGKQLNPKLPIIYNSTIIKIYQLIEKRKYYYFVSKRQGIPLDNYQNYLYSSSIQFMAKMKQFYQQIASEFMFDYQRDIQDARVVVRQAAQSQVCYMVNIKPNSAEQRQFQNFLFSGRARVHLSNLANKYFSISKKLSSILQDLKLRVIKQLVFQVKQNLKNLWQNYEECKRKSTNCTQFSQNSNQIEGQLIGRQGQVKTIYENLKIMGNNQEHRKYSMQLGIISFQSIRKIKEEGQTSLQSSFTKILISYIYFFQNLYLEKISFQNVGANDGLFNGFQLHFGKSRSSDYEKFTETAQFLNQKKLIIDYVGKSARELKVLIQHNERLLESIEQFLKQTLALQQEVLPSILNLINCTENRVQQKNQINIQVAKALKNNFLYFLQMREKMQKELAKIPDEIIVGIFVLSFAKFKKQYFHRAIQIDQSIKKYLPYVFKSITECVLKELRQIDSMISSYNWSLLQFTDSFKAQQMFEELQKNGSLTDYEESIQRLLIIFSKISQPDYKQKSSVYSQIRGYISKITSKIKLIETKRFQSIKQLKKKLSDLRQQISKELRDLQHQIYENINNREGEIQNLLVIVPEVQEKLMGLKKKVQNAIYIEDFISEKWYVGQKLFQKSITYKIEADVQMIKNFTTKFKQTESCIQQIEEYPLRKKSTKLLKTLQEISKYIRQIKVSKEQLVIYKSMLTKIQVRYQQYLKILKMANQISCLEEDEFKEYQKIIKNPIVYIKDLKGLQLAQEQKRIDMIFTKRKHRQEIQKLLAQIFDYNSSTALHIHIEIIKYIDMNKKIAKQEEEQLKTSKNKQTFSSKSLTDSDISSKEDLDNRKADNLIGINARKLQKKRRSAGISGSLQIPIFPKIQQIYEKLKEYQIQLGKVIKISKAFSIVHTHEDQKEALRIVKILIKSIQSLTECQQQYINLLKNNFIQGVSAFLDLENMYVEAKKHWIEQIVGSYGLRNLVELTHQNNQFMSQTYNFKKIIKTINKIVCSKITEKRKEIPLLNLCSNTTIIKIINNPLHFIHEFYQSSEYIFLDPEQKRMHIETIYQEQININFAHKSQIQLSSIRDRITQHVKLECYRKINFHLKNREKEQYENNFCQRGIFEQIYKQSQSGLIQVKYLVYWLKVGEYLRNKKQKKQENQAINYQIGKIKKYYEKKQKIKNSLLFQLDIFILVCLHWRKRLLKLKRQPYQVENEIGYEVKDLNCAQRLDSNTEAKKQIQGTSQNKIQSLEAKIVQKIFVLNDSRKKTRRNSLFARHIDNQAIQSKYMDKQKMLSVFHQRKDSKLRTYFNKFKVQLCFNNINLQLSYDLIDPKYLTDLSLSQSSINGIMSNIINGSPEIQVFHQADHILEISARLFRMYRKINHYQKEDCLLVITKNISLISEVMIAIQNKFLSERPEQKFFDHMSLISFIQDYFVLKDQQKLNLLVDEPKSRRCSLSLLINTQQTFLLPNLQEKKSKFRDIQIASPSNYEMLKTYAQSMKEKYAQKLISILLEYLQEYQYLLFNLKNQTLNFYSLKLMFHNLLGEITNIFCKNNMVNVSLEVSLILYRPLLALGLVENECETISGQKLQQIISQFNFSQSSKQLQKSKVRFNISSLSIEKKLDEFIGKESYFNSKSVVIVLGGPGSGKSFLINKTIESSWKQCSKFHINVLLLVQFTKFLEGSEHFQELKCKLRKKAQKKKDSLAGNNENKLLKQKMIIVYEGIENLSEARRNSTLQIIVKNEFSEIGDSNIETRQIIELTEIRCLSPRTILYAQLINIPPKKVSQLSSIYFQQIQVMICSITQTSQNKQFSRSNKLSETKSKIKKQQKNELFGKIKIIIKYIIKISSQILDKQAEIEKRFNLVVSNEQFYLVLKDFLTAVLVKYTKILSGMFSKYPRAVFLQSIQKIAVFSIYWVCYFVLTEQNERQMLFNRLIQIKQYQTLFKGSISDKNPQDMKIQHTQLKVSSLENKQLHIYEGGAKFVNLYANREGDSTKNELEMLYIQTPQLIKLSQFVSIILKSKECIMITGEKCTGKSKLIKKLMRDIVDSYQQNEGNSHQNRKLFQLQLELVHNEENSLLTKISGQAPIYKNKSRNLIVLQDFSRNLYRKIKQGRKSNETFLPEGQPYFVIYIDDSSLLTSTNNSIQNSYIKYLSEHKQIVANQEIYPVLNNKIIYQCTVEENRKKIQKQLMKKWFMFPILHIIGKDYFRTIFTKLIRQTVSIRQQSFHDEDQILETSIRDSNKKLQCLQKKLDIIQPFYTYIDKIIHQYQLRWKQDSKSNQFHNYKRANAESKRWYYHLNKKNFYKSIIDFISYRHRNNIIVNNNVSFKILEQNNEQEKGRKNEENNLILLQRFIVFNMVARLSKLGLPYFVRQAEIFRDSIKRFAENFLPSHQIQKNSQYNLQKNAKLVALQSLFSKGFLQKPIIQSQFFDNVAKLKEGLKISPIVLINKPTMLQNCNFLNLFMQIEQIKIHQIKGEASELSSKVEKIIKQENHNEAYIYIPLQSIRQNPDIINQIKRQTKIIYNVNQAISIEVIQSGNHIKSQIASFKDYLYDYRNGKQSFQQHSSLSATFLNNNNIRYIIQYPEKLRENEKEDKLRSQIFLIYSTVLYLESVHESSQYYFLNRAENAQEQKQNNIKAKQPLEQQNCIKTKNMPITLKYLTLSFPNLKVEQIQKYLKILQKIYEKIATDQKQEGAFWQLYKLLFNYSNFVKFCQNFFMLYLKNKDHYTNRLASLQSSQRCLKQTLFERFSELVIQNKRNRIKAKSLEEMVEKTRIQMNYKKQEIAKYLLSADLQLKNRLKKKCCQNEERLKIYKDRIQNFQKQAAKFQDQILRSQVAHLKFIYNFNYEQFKDLFDIIEIIFEQHESAEALKQKQQPRQSKIQDSEDKLKKYILDVNFIAKMKQISLESFQKEDVIDLLANKLSNLEKRLHKQKSLFMENIIFWVISTIKYLRQKKIYKQVYSKILKEISEDKVALQQVGNKYNLDEQQRKALQISQSFEDYQRKHRIARQAEEKQRKKVNDMSRYVENLKIYEEICSNLSKQLSNSLKCLPYSAILSSLKQTFLISMPSNKRQQRYQKYKKIMEKILTAQHETICKQGQFMDPIEEQLQFLSSLRENQQFNLSKRGNYFYTKEKSNILNIILRNLCYDRKEKQPITVIDPQNIFLRDIKEFTRLSIRVLEQNQSDQNIIEENFDLLVIKVAAYQWNLMPSVEEYQQISSKRLRDKGKISIKSGQRFILLKDKLQNIDEINLRKSKIIFYDTQMVTNILRQINWKDQQIQIMQLLSSIQIQNLTQISLPTIQTSINKKVHQLTNLIAAEIYLKRDYQQHFSASNQIPYKIGILQQLYRIKNIVASAKMKIKSSSKFIKIRNIMLKMGKTILGEIKMENQYEVELDQESEDQADSSQINLETVGSGRLNFKSLCHFISIIWQVYLQQKHLENIRRSDIQAMKFNQISYDNFKREATYAPYRASQIEQLQQILQNQLLRVGTQLSQNKQKRESQFIKTLLKSVLQKIVPNLQAKLFFFYRIIMRISCLSSHYSKLPQITIKCMALLGMRIQKDQKARIDKVQRKPMEDQMRKIRQIDDQIQQVRVSYSSFDQQSSQQIESKNKNSLIQLLFDAKRQKTSRRGSRSTKGLKNRTSIFKTGQVPNSKQSMFEYLLYQSHILKNQPKQQHDHTFQKSFHNIWKKLKQAEDNKSRLSISIYETEERKGLIKKFIHEEIQLNQKQRSNLLLIFERQCFQDEKVTKTKQMMKIFYPQFENLNQMIRDEAKLLFLHYSKSSLHNYNLIQQKLLIFLYSNCDRISQFYVGLEVQLRQLSQKKEQNCLQIRQGQNLSFFQVAKKRINESQCLFQKKNLSNSITKLMQLIKLSLAGDQKIDRVRIVFEMLKACQNIAEYLEKLNSWEQRFDKNNICISINRLIFQRETQKYQRQKAIQRQYKRFSMLEPQNSIKDVDRRKKSLL